MDLRLLNFQSYEDYLKALIKTEDYRYLSAMQPIRKLVNLGYRCSSKVYEQNEFHKLQKQLQEHINPKISSSVLYGNYFKGTDAGLKALVDREEANLLQKLSTIIFLQVQQRSGFDLSGYIDYEKSLRDCSLKVPNRTNWRAVFEGRARLRPKPNDLSFYDWHRNVLCYNDTYNFDIVRSSKTLMFKHKSDHKLIPVCDRPNPYSENVTRVMIPSEIYGYIILYDHIIR
ncbi:cilia- and flagella-associated protein 299-like isoform X1 [Drosophila novamexicana]|uniref:cilia- and flagella-associated protein 299-like isoform X1 n=1 Tax=Drosophila novamexicana TaxID=47314 RepID=UPI0011E5ED39|nr:cilia- and flagella-associated protein 299-like isoform X1 [Drosophila novamexicana]